MLAPDEAVAERDLGGDDADAAGAGLEDLVAEQQVLDLVAEVAELAPSTRLVSSIQPLGRSSLRPPMRSKFGWKRPPVTASIMVEDMLAVAERVEGRRSGAELHAHVAEEER